MAKSTTLKTFEVTKVVTQTTVYQVIAADEDRAEDAVYWCDSSGRAVQDARRVDERKAIVEYDVKESADIQVCDCNHFLAHHTDEGCGWDRCKCTQSGPSSKEE